MTLNQLSYFYQAAVLEHFNQAAEKMNITEPSLSRSIAALEDELGVILFEKRGRNVILTKAGEIFLEHVSTILGDVKRAENKMHQIATDGGHIDIAYVSPLAKVFIPTIVRSFLTEKENKNITFNFFQDITSVNIDGLKKGRYDIIFGSYSPDENGIDFVPIIKQEIVAILPPGHPLTLKDTMEATDFADYPVLGYARHSGLGKYTRSFFKKHDVSPNFICESPDENGIASLVVDGTRVDLLNNQVCLVTYKNSGTAVTGFADISKAKNMALADGTVPVGQYTRAALVNSKMVEGDASKPQAISDSDISKALDGLEINSCANVGAVASAVAEGANEIGTVYYSDTFGYENQLDIIEKLPNSLTGDVIYPIAALKGDSTTSDELEAAKEFIAYLQTDEAMSVFEKYHFSVKE